MAASKKKVRSLLWIEELLPEGVFRKPMFGGFAYYQDGRLILALFESATEKTYRGKTFPYKLWFGCLFPAERKNHPEICRKFPFLFPHPVLGKWLYLPCENEASSGESFEINAQKVLREIRRESTLFGVVPAAKKKKSNLKLNLKLNLKSKLRLKSVATPLDTKTPRMFADEPLDKKLATAKNISDLKNLGPKSETEFAQAGIKSVSAFFKLGWKKSLKKLVEANPKNRHSVFAYALIGALKNQMWHRISEEEKLEARDFVHSLKVKAKK